MTATIGENPAIGSYKDPGPERRNFLVQLLSENDARSFVRDQLSIDEILAFRRQQPSSGATWLYVLPQDIQQGVYAWRGDPINVVVLHGVDTVARGSSMFVNVETIDYFAVIRGEQPVTWVRTKENARELFVFRHKIYPMLDAFVRNAQQ